jgi:hypothetical protein
MKQRFIRQVCAKYWQIALQQHGVKLRWESEM